MALADWGVSNKPAIRAPINEMDKATIVSIYPRKVDEKKIGLDPGRFVIPAGSVTNPGILVVGSSSWFREMTAEEPLLEIPHSSVVMAKSIVDDWCQGLLGCDMQGARPGIFVIPGEHTQAKVVTHYGPLLKDAEVKQRNWYQNLVEEGDVMWSRSNGNPRAVSELMQMAAKELGFSNRAWMNTVTNKAMVPCIFCGSLRNPDYPICPNCKNADPNHPLTAVMKASQTGGGSGNPG